MCITSSSNFDFFIPVHTNSKDVSDFSVCSFAAEITEFCSRRNPIVNFYCRANFYNFPLTVVTPTVVASCGSGVAAAKFLLDFDYLSLMMLLNNMKSVLMQAIKCSCCICFSMILLLVLSSQSEKPALAPESCTFGDLCLLLYSFFITLLGWCFPYIFSS